MHDVKSYDFVKQYFSNPQLLVKAIKEYRRTANIPKGECSLSDLLRCSSLMPRWETNGVFFCLNQAAQSTEKTKTNSM